MSVRKILTPVNGPLKHVSTLWAVTGALINNQHVTLAIGMTMNRGHA